MVSTRVVVYVSMVASAVIAAGKFIAYLATGNAAMLSQVYYSLADVGNQILLLVGFRLSEQGANRKHPFGRGMEQYFFAFVVTVLLFGVAGFASVREGYSALGTIHQQVDVRINYAVLSVALVFESYALYKSYQAVDQEAKTHGFQTVFETIRKTKDAPLITAGTENLVAVIGVVVAIAGIYLTDVTGNTLYDATASALIGLLLMGLALGLAWENRSLMVGEGVTESEREMVVTAINGVEGVDRLVDLRTMHLGPDSILIACDISFTNDLDVTEVEAVVDAVERAIRETVPEAERIYIEAESQDVDDRVDSVSGEDVDG